MKKLFLLTGALIATGLSAHADITIADWTFETSAPVTAGPFSPEIGAGSASGSHASGAAVYSTPAGNGSTHSFSANTWAVNDYYQYTFSTLGLANIMLSFDQTGSATGPSKFMLAYSTDGTHFTQIGTDYTVAVSTWNTTTVTPAFTTKDDLSTLTAINNQATVYLRFIDDSTTSINGGTVATGGTDRMDNVILTSVVPEQSYTLGLLGLSVVGLGFARRNKK